MKPDLVRHHRSPRRRRRRGIGPGDTFHQIGTCLGHGIAVAAAATVPTAGSAVGHLAAQVSAALTTGSILLLLALAVTAALILPADLAARSTRTPWEVAPAPQLEAAR